MSSPVVYAGQFVEQLIMNHLAIAENLIKIYIGEYVGESFNVESLRLRKTYSQKRNYKKHVFNQSITLWK